MARVREFAFLGFLTLLTLGLRWRWIAGSLDLLVVEALPDDAFYYFEIAHQIWRGGGITFDGSAAATGMHPLWLLLILPLFAGASAGALFPVHGVLALAAFLTVGTAAIIHRLAIHLTGSWLAGALLALVFVVNRWTLRESINGLETTLAVFLLAAFAAAFMAYLDQPGNRRALLLGLIAAACILARSDTTVILIFPCLLLPWREGAFSRRVLYVAAPPAVAILALSLFNWSLTGYVLQSSATAVPWVGRANWVALHPDYTFWEWQRLGVGTVVFGVLRAAREMSPFMIASAVLSGMTVLTLLLFRRAACPAHLRSIAAFLLLFCVGLLALHFVHGYFRWIVRTYYFAAWSIPVLLLPALALGMAGTFRVRDRLSRLPMRRLVHSCLFGFVLVELWYGVRSRERLATQYDWQAEMLAAGRYVAQELPGVEPVGAFNAAIIAYVSERPVVNLDGVVNEEAVRAIRARALAEYIRSRGIRYLVDSPAMWHSGEYFASLEHWFQPDRQPPAFSVVHRIDIPGVGWPHADGGIEIIELLEADSANSVLEPSHVP